MLLTLYSLPEILFLKRHGLKGLYSWDVSWSVAYVPTMQLKKLATMLIVCSLGELKDVAMTTTFKRHVELLEVIEGIHKQKMMLL